MLSIAVNGERNVTVLNVSNLENTILILSRRNSIQNSTDDCYQSCLVGITAGATGVGIIVVVFAYIFNLVRCPRTMPRKSTPKIEGSPVPFDFCTGSILRSDDLESVVQNAAAGLASPACYPVQPTSDPSDTLVRYVSEGQLAFKATSEKRTLLSDHADLPFGLPFPKPLQDTGQRYLTVTPLGAKVDAELVLVPADAQVFTATSPGGFILRAREEDSRSHLNSPTPLWC
jgi:hypothetical protein